MLVVLIGSEVEKYQVGGVNYYLISEFLKLFQVMSNLIGMKYLLLYVFYGVNDVIVEDIFFSVKWLVEYIQKFFV